MTMEHAMTLREVCADRVSDYLLDCRLNGWEPDADRIAEIVVGLRVAVDDEVVVVGGMSLGARRRYAEASRAWAGGEGRSEDQLLQRIWNLAADSTALIDFILSLVAERGEVARLQEALEPFARNAWVVTSDGQEEPFVVDDTVVRYAPGMRDRAAGFCWRLNADGSRCCIRERGHDDGVHEEASGLHPDGERSDTEIYGAGSR